MEFPRLSQGSEGGAEASQPLPQAREKSAFVGNVINLVYFHSSVVLLRPEPPSIWATGLPEELLLQIAMHQGEA